MARPCSICTHPERSAIEQARLNGTSKRKIAALYLVSSDAVQRHASHDTAPVLTDNAPVRTDTAPQESIPHHDNAPPDTLVLVVDAEGQLIEERAPRQRVVSYPEFEVSVQPQNALDVLKQGLPYIRQAVRLAGDDLQAQERIVATLNEALQSETMGL